MARTRESCRQKVVGKDGKVRPAATGCVHGPDLRSRSTVATTLNSLIDSVRNPLRSAPFNGRDDPGFVLGARVEIRSRNFRGLILHDDIKHHGYRRTSGGRRLYDGRRGRSAYPQWRRRDFRQPLCRRKGRAARHSGQGIRRETAGRDG